MGTATLPVDARTRAAVIEGLLAKLQAYYIFPAVAQEVEEAIRRRLSNGEYDGIATAAALCDTLTAHLQEVGHDKHLRLFHRVEPRPLRGDTEDGQPSPEELEEVRQLGLLRNFGFQKVERLPGNVGYLDLRGFYPPEVAGETAVAAMGLLANTGALIVDLRQNGGGSPAMVALLCSFLFEARPIHLNDLYWRADDSTHQWWTLPYLPGKRYRDKPVYVLTSGDTFSGAEEFTYNLKTLERATIIGEVTGGGAHPGARYQIDEHFTVNIPTGRAINPITGTNWEGTGVIPDVDVPRERALQVAQIAALKQIIAGAGDNPTGPFKALTEEARAALRELS